MQLVICAAPGYLKRRGVPRSAADLAQRDVLTYAYARATAVGAARPAG